MIYNYTLFSEDDLLPISALQHILFCERQCALIHIEKIWVENRYTAEGRVMHERVHEADQKAGRIRIEYGMPLRSMRLGLSGIADVVELRCEPGEGEAAVRVPFPVEYKLGKPKKNNCDKVQICAQALCLEEMLGVEVRAGALFYGKRRRRTEVIFDDTLREQTRDAAKRLHELVLSGRTPPPVYMPECDSCSLVHLCLPRVLGRKPSVAGYLSDAVGGL